MTVAALAPPPWPARVKVLAGMMSAVILLAATLVGMIVKSTNYFAARDTRQDKISQKLDELQASVTANHDQTVLHIATLEQSFADARQRRNDELVRVGDRIGAIQTDVARIEGQIGYSIRNARR